nr:hypothetical protein RFYW14_00620 [Pseudorhizobium flavum]
MIGFIFSPIGKALAAAVVAAGVVSGAVFYGKSVGRQETAVEALERSVEVLRERNQTDDEVSASDAADLCRSMGLLEQDRLECVRRLVEADPQP